MNHNRLMVTAALPYANGPLHVGHIAGAYLPADLYCRYQRLKGRDVVFVCGSDEHGVPIMLRARAEKRTPKEIADRYHAIIESTFEKLGIAFDYYGRTTSKVHAETSRDFFRKLAFDDVFRIKSEEQLFDPEAEMFLADRFVVGTCPNCQFEEAFGDQCERCGISLSPAELINPRSTITQATPVMNETTHWYLPLGEFEDRLRTWIDSHPEWKPNVLGQVRSWLNEGLRDRAVTRDLPWGIPVPEDVAEAIGVDASGKVLYVWFDAPIGYISATKEWAAKKGDPDRWKKYWQAEDSKLVHFIGKDNIVFHCLIFPAMLMAHGKYVLPENVPSNEFLNLEGKKLSTSRNWAIWVHEHLAEFPPDPFRYALATMLPESKDSDFSWSDFQARVNSELADVLGNFVHRTTTFATRYFDGKVPPLESPQGIDLEVLAKLAEGPSRIGKAYESFRFRDAVFETMAIARIGNKYFNDTEPWRTIKTDPETCGNTLHVSLQLCAALAVLLDPIVPHSAAKLRETLNLAGVRSSAPDASGSGDTGWDQAAFSLLPSGHVLGTPEPLFTKMEDEVVEAERAKLGKLADSEQHNYEPVGDPVDFDTFAKLDLRVASVVSAEKVEGTDKLLRLIVDLGFERRQILAGLAMHIKPEDLVSRRVVIVANLKPRKIRGLESQGMLLAAETPDGRLVPVAADADEGSVVR
ncbi:MAG: methionine--tRNA ligase [Rhodothermales bacterium]